MGNAPPGEGGRAHLTAAALVAKTRGAAALLSLLLLVFLLGLKGEEPDQSPSLQSVCWAAHRGGAVGGATAAT